MKMNYFKKALGVFTLVAVMASCSHHSMRGGGCGGCKCDGGKPCAMDSKDTTKKAADCDDCKKGH